ncbi:MAG: chromosome partitioning protein ParB [Stutzerimonas stutzeri]|nr:MAG: chromosome partitioning protein ParB [Stutzerimonas stutzeri]
MQHYPIELTEIGALVPYEANAKKHSDQQVADLSRLIQKAGWTQPIVVDKDGVIIAGHGRRLAAIKLGLKKVPVIWRRDLSKAEADALRLADNRIASTDYDQAAIQIELQRLADELTGDLKLSDLGFDEKELDFTLSDLGDINEDFFVDDVSAAVEEQKQSNEKAIETTDDTAAPVGDALGFKRVTIAQSRELRELMARVEQRSGKKGVEALIYVLSAA